MMIRTKKIVIGVLTFGALAAVGFVLGRALFYSPTDEAPAPLAIVEQTTQKALAYQATQPTSEFKPHLSIPKLKIDAKVQNVGITKKGNMGVPSNYTDVGWYKYGPLPGETGSSVVAGHVDNGLGIPAVFNKLGNLTVGDDVYVEMEKGNILHFKVKSKQEYAYDAKVAEVFKQKDGKYLKLITCSGVWVPENKTHNKRLVVTAVLVE